MTAPNASINKLLMRVAKRAEKSTPAYLAHTFVPVEPMPALLEGADNQVLYGRRGTGKTHFLKYLAQEKLARGDVAVYIDLRTIGSSGGLYSDRNQSVALRATHLLVDVIEHLHNLLMDLVLESSSLDDLLDNLVPALDSLAAAATEVEVIGETERIAEHEVAREKIRDRSAKISLGRADLQAAGSSGTSSKDARRSKQAVKQTGIESVTVKFGPLGRALTHVTKALDGRQLWILIDEWSSVPRDLQPLLADLLRRSFFPVGGISIKIGALERQSQFRVNLGSGDYLGIDLGADTSASVDLDDFLVFRADRSHAATFYGQLLFQHLSVLMNDLGFTFNVADALDFRRLAFEPNAFSELVKAAEGVPRDALNIAGLAAAVASDKPISRRDVNLASRDYFLRDKEGKTSSGEAALLARIVTECVNRNSRQLALLRPQESDNPSIQALYDNRLLHRIQQGYTMESEVGKRFDLYLVDYGCFVDILLRGEGRAVSDGTDVPRLVNDESRTFGSPVLRAGWIDSVNAGEPRKWR